MFLYCLYAIKGLKEYEKSEQFIYHRVRRKKINFYIKAYFGD